MGSNRLVHISDDEVLRLISIEDCILSVKKGLIAYKSEDVIAPKRTVCTQPDGLFLDMPSGIPSRGFYGTKISLLQPNKPFPNGKIYKTSIFAMENKDPYRTFVVDAVEITRLRTAAVVTVAAEFLIAKDTSEISVIGAGNQAETMVEFLCHTFPIHRVHVFNHNDAQISSWISRMVKKLNHSVELKTVDLSSCLSKKTVIMATSTASAEPIVKQFGLEFGQTILSIGGAAKEACEFASDLLYKASVFVDSDEAVWKEAGEFQSVDRSRVKLISLDSLVSATSNPDFIKDEQNKIFKSVGLGFLDLFVSQSAISKLDDKNA